MVLAMYFSPNSMVLLLPRWPFVHMFVHKSVNQTLQFLLVAMAVQAGAGQEHTKIVSRSIY
jgi:hypothetical protein